MINYFKRILTFDSSTQLYQVECPELNLKVTSDTEVGALIEMRQEIQANATEFAKRTNMANYPVPGSTAPIPSTQAPMDSALYKPYDTTPESHPEQWRYRGQRKTISGRSKIYAHKVTGREYEVPLRREISMDSLRERVRGDFPAF